MWGGGGADREWPFAGDAIKEGDGVGEGAGDAIKEGSGGLGKGRGMR